jgi:pyruvate kinase
MIQETMKVALSTGVACMSDKILLIAGLPLNSPNMINNIRVLILGTVLAQAGSSIYINPSIYRAYGRIIHATNIDEVKNNMISLSGDKILVCSILTDEYIPILCTINGVICEAVSEICEQKLKERNPNLVLLTQVRNASKTLETGLTVTIDAKELLVYEGTVNS